MYISNFELDVPSKKSTRCLEGHLILLTVSFKAVGALFLSGSCDMPVPSTNMIVDILGVD